MTLKCFIHPLDPEDDVSTTTKYQCSSPSVAQVHFVVLIQLEQVTTEGFQSS